MRVPLRALQLLGYASAAHRTTGVSGLVLHAVVFSFFLRPEDFLTAGERHAHPLADRVRVFDREHENVSQEGFDARRPSEPKVLGHFG